MLGRASHAVLEIAMCSQFPISYSFVRDTPEKADVMAITSSSEETSMPVLTDILQRLELTHYHNVLMENGFCDWDAVLDITEYDLATLGFKLGHRRVLQREIATSRGIPSSLPLTIESPSSSVSEFPIEQTSSPPPREKRRYRRHPRPDINAPRRPKTAYVNFADHLRLDPDISSLSFVDIAKQVGRRWRHLPAEQKRIWERQAARAIQEYEAQMDEYRMTDNCRKYQSYLNDFRVQQSMATANPKRPAFRRSTSRSHTQEYSRASSSSSISPDSPPSPSSTGTEAEVCHNALTVVLEELVSLQGEILDQGTCSYDQQHLPSEELVRRAMYAFVAGTGSLLFMWTYAQVDEILDRIYRPTRAVDSMTLAECFIVAAMGANYDANCFPDRIRKVLYASGTLQFDEQASRMDYLRTMRLLLSMSFYALLEKHMSARYLIAAGLEIARWKCPALPKSNYVTVYDTWKPIYRSLIFMDCWLSYTLGYDSNVNSTDIALACSSYYESKNIDELIHVQTSKIGLIAAEISKTLASPELATRENITILAEKLDRWCIEMPFMLQISTLTSNNPPELTLCEKRAILMAHVMYLGAIVLLYRHLLIISAKTQLTDGAAWNLKRNLSVEDVSRYRLECAMAAQQIAHILSLIYVDGTLTKRCWIIIYWAFTACIVLLFSATTKLLRGQPDAADEDLTYAKSCMDMLEPSRNFEPIAARFLDTLRPLYDALRGVHHRMVGRAKTSISTLIQVDSTQLSPPVPISKDEMEPISEKLSVLLTDPFGRKQNLEDDSCVRRVPNADGSCSVFWWR